jgi:hypothetical protein
MPTFDRHYVAVTKSRVVDERKIYETSPSRRSIENDFFKELPHRPLT